MLRPGFSNAVKNIPVLERIVQLAVQTGLREQPKIFFFEEVKKLIERFQKCVIVQGDYTYVEE
jgi:hypothetical protein